LTIIQNIFISPSYVLVESMGVKMSEKLNNLKICIELGLKA